MGTIFYEDSRAELILVVKLYLGPRLFDYPFRIDNVPQGRAIQISHRLAHCAKMRLSLVDPHR
jgi:hypothetical protein